MTSIDGLIIPKTVLQGIANAIRGKTGSTETIKVKDMATSIENIPQGSTAIPTTITASLEEDSGKLSLEGHLGVHIEEDSSVLTGDLGNSIVYLSGRNGFFWDEINTRTTNSAGAFKHNVDDYEEYKIEYKKHNAFQESSCVLTVPTLTAIVNIDEYEVHLKLVEGEGLKTIVDGVTIENDNGEFTANVSLNEDSKIVYKGPMTSLSYNPYWEGVVSLHAPSSIINLGDTSMFSQNGYIKELFLQDSGITESPLIRRTPNLKVVRLPDTITSFNEIGQCNLDYLNVPGKNNPSLSNVSLLHMSTVQCFDIENGFNQRIDLTAFDIDDSAHMENVHFILPGKPIGQDVPDLQFSFPFRSGNYRNCRISFQADTEKILEGSAEEIRDTKCINIPAGCTEIEKDAFRYVQIQSPAILRFEGLIPPKFGDYNYPADCFPSNIEDYHVLCPRASYDVYDEHIGHFSGFTVISEGYDDYPVYNDLGEFCIEVLGRNLKTNPDIASPFIDSGGEEEVPFYIDDVVQDELFDFDNALDFNFPYYGRHTVTVAAGFRRIREEGFMNNKDIIKVRFPEGLDEIESFGFTGCSNLRTLIFPALSSPPSLEEEGNVGPLDGLHPDCKIFVPDWMVEYYAGIPDFNQYTIIGMKTEYDY